MKVIEAPKKGYKNINDAIKDGCYNIWDDERIIAAFKFGKGEKKHMRRYMKENKNYCYFKILKD